MLAAYGLGVIAATFIGKLPPALPPLREAFDLSLVAAGWLSSAFNVLAIVGAIACGVLADRIGAARACAWGLALLAGGTVAGALAHSNWLLFVSRFVEGAGFIFTVVAAPALISQTTAPSERRLSLGLWASYMPAGTTIVLLIAPAVLARADWRMLWWIELFFVLAGAWVLWHFRQAYRPSAVVQRKARTIADIVAPMRRLGPWILGLAFACYTFQFYAIMVWLPTYLIDMRQLSVASAAWATAAMVAINIPGNLFGAWLAHRGMARGTQMMCGAAAMGLGSFIAFSAAPPDVVRFAGCLFFSFAGGLVPSSVLSGSQTHARAPTEVATLQGVMVQVANLGQFLGPPLVAICAGSVSGSAANWDGVLDLLLYASALGGLLGFATRWLEKLKG